MRAKNEAKFLAEAYKKVILERVVDGKLMCPEACCGAPVMECKCGPDCPHCNCHEIQKLAKEEDNEDIFPNSEYGRHLRREAERHEQEDKRVRLTLDSPGYASVQLPKGHPNIQKYLDKGYKIVKDYKKAEQAEDNEEAGRAFATPELKRKDKQRQMWAKRKERWDAWKKKQARSEDQEFDGPGMQWDGIDDPLPGSLGPKVTPTHKPYVTSYTSNDNKKVFDVLDSNGQPVFRTHNKREAYKWFKTYYSRLHEDGEDPYTTLDATVRDFEQELDIQGDGIDTNVNELKDYIDIINGLKVSEVQKKSALKYLSELRGPGGRAGLEDVDYNFVFGIAEDAEDRDRRHHPQYGEPEYDEERSERLREDPPITSAPGKAAFPDLTDQDETKRRMKQLGWEDNETPRDSMYLKDDPEALKKALIWHHGNYAKLRQKSIRGEQLTDDEWDSLKHSEGELDLHDQLQR